MKSLKCCYTLKNGVEIPCVGFGTWQTPEGAVAENAVRSAIEAGYVHIDTAMIYGNETGVGKGIRDAGVSREDLFITTKLWNTDHGYETALKAFDGSMKRLGIDYCDLYLIHWPNPAAMRDCWQQKNAESWKAMEKLYEEGRIRAIGISNFMPHHIDALLKTANIMPMVNQICVNPARLPNETIEKSRALGMLIEAYSPLGTGKLLQNPELAKVAAKYGKTPAQVCIRWSLDNGYLPLPKSITAERIRSNTEIFDFTLAQEDMRALSALNGSLGEGEHPDKVDF